MRVIPLKCYKVDPLRAVPEPTVDSRTESGITGLLRAWTSGDRRALEDLTPLIYEQLHQAAHRYMQREKPGHLLQSTAVINELYIRLATLGDIEWQDRGHFFAVCAQLMRRILTDYARLRLRQKREGQLLQVPLNDRAVASPSMRLDLLALDEALEALAVFDERKGRVVELRFFGGLSVEEIAQVLKVSERTINEDWKLARVWLLRELNRGRNK